MKHHCIVSDITHVPKAACPSQSRSGNWSNSGRWSPKYCWCCWWGVRLAVESSPPSPFPPSPLEDSLCVIMCCCLLKVKVIITCKRTMELKCWNYTKSTVILYIQVQKLIRNSFKRQFKHTCKGKSTIIELESTYFVACKIFTIVKSWLLSMVY